jgi:response regulator RpfG family c-di-GMP phosphodiesterase
VLPPSLPPRASERIVVVDSNPILVSVTGVLRMAGYCVFQAYNGQAAKELCITLPDIALLVLNTHVDGMADYALFTEARASGTQLPILHIDSHRSEHVPSDIPTLIHPFTTEQLLSAVEKLLEARVLSGR